MISLRRRSGDAAQTSGSIALARSLSTPLGILAHNISIRPIAPALLTVAHAKTPPSLWDSHRGHGVITKVFEDVNSNEDDGQRRQRAPVGVASNLVVRTNTPPTDIGGQGRKKGKLGANGARSRGRSSPDALAF